MQHAPLPHAEAVRNTRMEPHGVRQCCIHAGCRPRHASGAAERHKPEAARLAAPAVWQSPGGQGRVEHPPAVPCPCRRDKNMRRTLLPGCASKNQDPSQDGFPGTAYTQPVGLGRPAILQAPFPGPDGKSSYTSFSLYPVFLDRIRTIGAMPFLR